MEKQVLFALDIGTRSVVGLIGEQADKAIKLTATDRQEHHTRAMLDGQIHDVLEVANVLDSVKKRLEHACGHPLKKVAVAAAGRALCTIKATAEIENNGRILSADDENALELAAIQAAQQQLATSNAVPDPTAYYCVGYSVVTFTLDQTPLKSLIGQRGRSAGIELIATFLPRQVIDSLQSAIEAVGLEISTLTLEPIAAISVLIPPTMRHLNLTLVDVGAGTSDVAITREGSVIGFGMVPFAGDEITEAISQKYLLDFNVAEQVKRQLTGKNRKITFNDVLGCTHKVAAQQILDDISPNVVQLAQAIAAQIISLNTVAPQAVLLVGGGSLTPMLPEALAQALDVPTGRVAIRRPESIDGLTGIPDSLHTPDAVTPLGILKLSSSRTLNFVNVTLNDQLLHLFNLGNLTIADALLAAGIDVRTLQARPGLGITLTVNDCTQFIPGSAGTPGAILLNGEPASYQDPIQEDDVITVKQAIAGITPHPKVKELVEVPTGFTVTVNDTPVTIAPLLEVNGQPASVEQPLQDRDTIVCQLPNTLQHAALAAGISAEAVDFTYIVNGVERRYSIRPQQLITRNQIEFTAQPASVLQAGDSIRIVPPSEPTAGEILGLTSEELSTVAIQFNNKPCCIPVAKFSLQINGKPGQKNERVAPGSIIEYSHNDKPTLMVSDALLAAKFDPRSLPTNAKVTLLLNGKPAEYIAKVMHGDKIDVKIEA